MSTGKLKLKEMYCTDFINIVKAKGFTESEAQKCLDVYTKLKVYTYNAHDGMKLKHGAFLDADVIKKAITT